MKHTPCALLAIALVSLTFPRLAAAEPGEAPLVEDNWWQTDARSLDTYVEIGPHLHLLAEETTPPDTSFLIGFAGASVQAGRWFHPMFAYEVEGLLGGGESGGFLSNGNSALFETRIGVGARFALPTYLSPVAVAHLAYDYQVLSWQNDPYEVNATAGEDSRHALLLDGGAGLELSYGWFKMDALVTGSVNLTSDTQRIITGDAVAQVDGDAFDLPAEPDFFAPMDVGAELRIGARF